VQSVNEPEGAAEALAILLAAAQGDRRMLARAISMVEVGREPLRAGIGRLGPRRALGPGAPHVVGLSGPPGSGKSSLADRLVTGARRQGRSVAVVAVDPASPFTGGAILGDRVRMDSHSGDPGVFIRSLSSRGHLGGLSLATGAVVDLLDLCSFDLVLVETVGVGQSEIAVMEVADTVAVVLTPESGDTVQTMKAGLMEIADLFVVNKADRPGANFIARDLEAEIDLDPRAGWRVPVFVASALRDEGIDAVLTSVGEHLSWLCGDGRARWTERRAAGRLRAALDIVAQDARKAAFVRLSSGDAMSLAEDLHDGRIDAQTVARRLRGGS
jgi:LAO/AO transport system kinase